jgi:transposase
MTKNTIDILMSIGVDIGKDIFHLASSDYNDQLVLRKRIKQLAFLQTFENIPK